MLTIHECLVKEMLDHCYKQAPIEACGIISGPDYSNWPVHHIPMKNAANSSRFFRFESAEQLRVWRQMDSKEHIPQIIYHSHTQSAAYPSKEDIEYALEPLAHYVIVATDASFNNTLRSYRIIDSSVIEERICIVAEYPEKFQNLLLNNKHVA